jgi:ferredoxin
VSAGFDERIIHGLRVRIDRDLCVGFGDCITEAPGAFRLDAEGMAEFENPERVTSETLLRACDACPVDAITVWDAEGRQVVP